MGIDDLRRHLSREGFASVGVFAAQPTRRDHIVSVCASWRHAAYSVMMVVLSLLSIYFVYDLLLC